jgi:hypothetical protein
MRASMAELMHRRQQAEQGLDAARNAGDEEQRLDARRAIPTRPPKLRLRFGCVRSLLHRVRDSSLFGPHG